MLKCDSLFVLKLKETGRHKKVSYASKDIRNLRVVFSGKIGWANRSFLEKRVLKERSFSGELFGN